MDSQESHLAPVTDSAFGDNYTMVVLTFNRPTLVKALLAFLGLSHPHFRIIVLDHGDAKSQALNARVIAESQLINVEHLRFSDNLDLRDVLVDGLSAVDSEFSSIFPDDDIPHIQGIEASVRYLASHPRYVAAQGYVLSFTEQSRHIRIHDVADFVPSFVGDNPLSRLLQLSRRFQPVIFAVYRTEVLKWSHRRLKGLSTANVLFRELFHASLIAFKGDIARVPEIFMLRRITGSYLDRRHIHPVYQMIDSPATLASEYAYFRDQLLDCFYADSFSDESIINRKEATRIVDLIHMFYFIRHLAPPEVCVETEILKYLDTPDRSYFETLQKPPENVEADSSFRELAMPVGGLGSSVSAKEATLQRAREFTQAISQGQSNDEIRITTTALNQIAEHIRGYSSNAP